MNICFVNTPDLPGDLPGTPWRYITSQWAVRQALIARGDQPLKLEDLLSCEEAQNLEQFIQDLVRHWCKSEDENLTCLDDLYLGAPLSWALWYATLVPLYKFAAMASRLVAQEQPAEIIWMPAAEPRLEAVLRQVCARWAPQATLRVRGGTAEAPTNLKPKNMLPPTISRRHRLAFGVFNLLGRLLSPGRPSRPAMVYFNYQTLDSFMLALLKAQHYTLVFANRPTNKLWLTAARQGARYLIPEANALSAADREALARLQARWRAVSQTAAYQARFRFNEVDLWPCLQPELDALFTVQLPETLALMRGCQKALRRLKPRWILLPADTPYLHRSLIEVGHSLGIPSAVLLHGLPPTSDLSGQNFQADYVFAWGPAVRELFVALGSSAERVVLTGFPNLDQYYPPRPGPAGGDRPRRVLVLTHSQELSKVLSSGDEHVIYLQAVLETLRDLPGIELAIRPHPVEPGDHYRQLLAQWGLPHITVYDQQPMSALLTTADLVIGDRSTVAVEALAAGIPYLCVRFNRCLYDAPFDGASGIEVITETAVLRERVIQFIAGTLPTTSSDVLRQYTGPLDGQATRRVLEALDRLSPAPPTASHKEQL